MSKAKIATVFSMVFLMLINLSSLVFAASNELKLPQNTDPKVMEMPSVFSLFFQLIISLVVIVVLAYYTLKFLRKNMQLKAVGDSISVLDQHAFGLNKGIYVTEIGEKVYVLGVTDHNINLVTEINDQNLIEEMRTRAAQRQLEPVVPEGLTSIATNLMKKLKLDKKGNDVGKNFKTHIQAQVNKLQSMYKTGQEEGKNEKGK